jgi:TP901 family phage tail tape measure protein
MAGAVVERLIIEIGGDAKKFKEELKSLQKANKKGEASFKQLALIGKAGFLAVAAAAAALTVASTKAFVAFEKGAINVAKTTNLAGKELEEFKKEIITLSEKIPVTTDKLLEIATAAGQLGIKGADNLLIFTETIAKLGATTDLEGEAAAIGIARILNLVGEGTETVDRFGSAIVDLGNNFETSESQILEIATEVAKATVNFKLSSPEVLGLATAMSSLGIEAEAGSTVVGKAFMKIDEVIRKQAGPQFEKLIELSGMTGEELTQTFQTDATKVFEAFVKGLGRAGDSGKSMVGELEKLGLSGIRVNKILPTLAERSDKLSEALKRSGTAAKENSALNKEAATAFESSASKLAIAQNKINNALIEMGAVIAPEVVKAIEGISDAVRENSGIINKLAAAIGFSIKTIIVLFSEGGKVLDSFVAKMKMAGTFISAIVYFWTGIFLDFWKLNIKTFGAISDVINNFVRGVIKYFKIFKDVSGKVFDDISAKAGTWVDEFRSKTKPIQQIASNIIGVFLAVRAATTKIFDSINNKIGEFVDSFREKITQVQGWVSSVTPDFLKFGDDATEGTNRAGEAVKESSKSIIESIGELIAKYKEAGKEWLLSDEEVTLKTEENKEKRIESQKDETDNVKKETRARADAVIALAEEQRGKQEKIEADRLKRQAELNAAELELLKAQLGNKSKIEIDALQSRFDQIKESNEINNEILKLQEKENLSAIEQQQLDHLKILSTLKRTAYKEEAQSLDDLLKEVRKGEKTKNQIIVEGIIEREKARVKEHNQRLKDEVEFGRTMASIKDIQRSAEYQGTKNAASEMAVLINSENDNLKAIGKAATIVQIGISTVESAMKAYSGLAWIPVVGFGLGILAAAAVSAYGAEQINNVRQMKEGGIVPGVGRGDKVPALLEPGELVVPRDVTAEIMKQIGARRMADGGVATGSKENKNLYQTFADMFNPAVFVKALVYEFLGWESKAGEGASEAQGFGAEMFGGMIGGMIEKATGGVQELADLVLNQLPGGKYLQKMMKWSRLPEEKLKEIIADIAGKGPLYDFLAGLDENLSNKMFDEVLKIGGDVGTFLYDIGGSIGGIIGDIGSGLGFQNGGIVPGTGSGDIVPAFLEPGELVVPKDLTSSLLNISSGFGNIQIPASNQDAGIVEGGEKRIVVELLLNENAAEVINAQIREGDRLGFLNRN